MTRPDFNDTGSTVFACLKTVDFLKPLCEGGSREIDKVPVVERHIGRFNTAEEVKRWLSNRDGAIRVAVLNVEQYEKIGGRVIGTVNMAAYVFASDKFGYSKDTRVEAIAGKVAAAMMTQGGPPQAYAKAERVRADNLYSGSSDDLGVAFWAVSWTQKWYLDVPLDLATLDDFLRFNLRGELADGAPELEGDVNLPQGD